MNKRNNVRRKQIKDARFSLEIKSTLPGDVDDFESFETELEIFNSEHEPQKVDLILSNFEQNDHISLNDIEQVLKHMIDHQIKLNANHNISIKISDFIKSSMQTSVKLSQIFFQISRVLDLSFLFGFKFAIETSKRFTDYSSFTGTLKSIGDLINLYSLIFQKNSLGSQLMFYFIKVLIKNRFFDRVSSALFIYLDKDFDLQQVRDIYFIIASFLLSIAKFNLQNKLEPELKAEFVETLQQSICPSIVNSFFCSIHNQKAYNAHFKLAQTLSIFSLVYLKESSSFIDDNGASQLSTVLKKILEEVPKPDIKKEYELARNELILVFGLFASRNKYVQKSALYLPNPTLLSILCKLDYTFFINPVNSRIVIPTIIACCLDNEENLVFVKENLNSLFVTDFLDKVKTNERDRFAPSFRFPIEEIEKISGMFRIK